MISNSFQCTATHIVTVVVIIIAMELTGARLDSCTAQQQAPVTC